MGRLPQLLLLLLGLSLVEAATGPKTQTGGSREPWHILKIASQTFNVSLTSPAFLEAQKLCLSLKDYDPDECLSLALQTHRTSRQVQLDSFASELGWETNEAGRLLAYSYAFEPCPHDLQTPINVCFFGEIPPLVVLFALLSCDLYRLQFLNVFDTEAQRTLLRFRELFPSRAIQWIPGRDCPFPPPLCSPSFPPAPPLDLDPPLDLTPEQVTSVPFSRPPSALPTATSSTPLL
jgi:hypothetical protein